MTDPAFESFVQQEDKRRTETGVGGHTSVPGLDSELHSLSVPESQRLGRTIEDNMLNYLNPAMPVAGGMVGAEIGSRLGPLGLVAGGALGAAGGALVPGAIRDVGRLAGVKGLAPPMSYEEAFQLAAREALLDISATAGAPYLGRALRFGTKSLLATFGVNKAARAYATKTSLEEGMGLTPLAVSNYPGLTNFIKSTIGRFPLFHTPIKRGAEYMATHLQMAKDRLLFQVGPSINMAEAGVNLNNAMNAQYSKFRVAINAMYDKAFKQADANGATIPIKETMTAIGNGVDMLQRTFGAVPKAMQDFMETAFKDLAVDMPARRFRGLAEQIDGALGKADTPAERAMLLRVKKAMNRDLLQMTDGDALRQILTADGVFYKSMTEVFDTPLAKSMETSVTRNRFHVGMTKAGSKYPSQTLELAFRSKSPQAMNDLLKLVGPKQFEGAVFTKINDLWETALTRGKSQSGIGGFDLGWFEKQMGLHYNGSNVYAMYKSALDKTAVPMDRFERFFDRAKKVYNALPNDVNNFIARRVTLGGWRAITGVFLPGVSAAGGSAMGGLAGGGLVSAAGLFMVGRGLTEMMSNPRLIQMAEVVLNPHVAMQRRRIIGLMLLHTLGGRGLLGPAHPYSTNQQ